MSLANKPTQPDRRIESVDIVRGFALFGVLLVNMYNFGATFPVWNSLQDEIALSLTQIFFETKSFRLFSFLFGFGIALQLSKISKTGKSFYFFYLRRMIVLFLIGMANCLLYDGDVLMLYAEFGIILLLFRKVPANVLLIGWLVLNLTFPIQRAYKTYSEGQSELKSAKIIMKQSQENIEKLKTSHPYNVGSIREVMAFNSKAIPPNPLDETSFLGMCLLGIYAARKRYFQEPKKHIKLIKNVCIWGVIVGLVAMTIIQLLKLKIGYSMAENSGGSLYQKLMGDLCLVFGSTALSMGYAAGIIWFSQTRRFILLLTPLKMVGRFALTTYLFQTIMFSTLFYGYAFGQGLYLGPFAVIMFAIFFFLIQIIACNLWARYFRYGPAEWLWRSISYVQRIPIRKRD